MVAVPSVLPLETGMQIEVHYVWPTQFLIDCAVGSKRLRNSSRDRPACTRRQAGLSDETFPLVVQLKPAPGRRWLTTGLSSPFVHLVVTTMVRSESGLRTRSCTAWRVGIPPPQGPSLGSGL
jgi:hypothetical protein